MVKKLWRNEWVDLLIVVNGIMLNFWEGDGKNLEMFIFIVFSFFFFIKKNNIYI